jgi:hypothetical protein
MNEEDDFQILDVGELNCEYSTHPLYVYFKSMIRRAEEQELPCSYTLCLESFNQWQEYIGDIPVGMKIPTVGRNDHTKGYVPGNFKWQSKSDNSKEMVGREVGMYGVSQEQRAEWSQKGGCKAGELGKTGFQTQTSEQKTEYGRRTAELGKGVHAATPEQRREWGNKAGSKSVASPNHISKTATPEQRREWGNKAGRNSTNSPNHNNKREYTCPHPNCGRVGKGLGMLRHIKYCKLRCEDVLP